MNTITILIDQQDDQIRVVHYVGGELDPVLAANACRAIAARFDEQAREAEITRRVAEALQEANNDADTP